MPDALLQFADEVRQNYFEPIAGEAGRLERGSVLWSQFEAAVDACREGRADADRQLTEKVNELAIAKILLDDRNLVGPIQYEPNILPSGRKIDFVAIRALDYLYVEVKTVHPRAVDSEASWNRFLELREHHPPNVEFDIQREGMGGQFYGNLIASRSKFLDYTMEFETRLQEAKENNGGPGVLAFCGNGFAWRRPDLEDFADFYRLGNHRADDAFSRMERHSMEQNGQVLLGNIDHISCLMRAVERPLPEEFRFSIRGPRWAGPMA